MKSIILKRNNVLPAITVLLLYVAIQYTHYAAYPEEFGNEGLQPYLCSLFDATFLLGVGYIVSFAGRSVKVCTAIAFVTGVILCYANVVYARIFGVYISLSILGEGSNLPVSDIFTFVCDATRISDVIYVVLSALFCFVHFRTKKKDSCGILVGMSFVWVGLALSVKAVPFVPTPESKLWEPMIVDYKCGFVRGELLYGVMNMSKTHEITEYEKTEITEFLLDKSRTICHDSLVVLGKKNVAFFICESYMSLTADLTIDGERVTPTLDSLRRDSNTLYNGNVIPNIRMGESGDGQFIYMTGLLPLADELTITYAQNDSFESLGKYMKAEGYQTSMTIPTENNVWHQKSLSSSYSIDYLFSTSEVDGMSSVINDSLLIDYAISNECKLKEPYIHFVLTYSSHGPYNQESPYRDYLKRCHYMDSQIKRYISYLQSTGKYENTLLVFVADHDVNKEFFGKDATKKSNRFVPFMVCNTNRVWDKKYSAKTMNQIDVFPTLLDLFGAKAKYRGIGNSLFDDTKSNNITDEMEKISSKIIRGNFFKTGFGGTKILSTVDNHIIAHAGGEIEGHKYTNSKEAVINSLNHGVRYIELDLALTEDKELVAVHDWAEYNKMIGNIDLSHVPTLKEFKSKKIWDRYTPLDYRDILRLMGKYQQMVLVTDKISDPDLINKHFGRYRNRVMVECFSMRDYDFFMDNGYLLSMYPMTSKRKLYHDMLRGLCLKNSRYSACTLSLNECDDYDASIKCIYTAENKKEAKKILSEHKNVCFVYVDKIE